MATVINEQTQFVSLSGKPIVNGSIYIGSQGSDPEAVPITIYSDRALTTVLSNPQSTDSYGRSVNKIWIPGKYSIKVKDSAGVQRFIDTDAGEPALSVTGVTVLDNLSGTNTITAVASPPITSYSDQAVFSLKINTTNTGAVTINIDGIGAKTLKRNVGQDVVRGQVVANEVIVFQYNSTDDTFHWLNENQVVEYANQGADLAAAATVNLASATGNYLKITGSGASISSFGTLPAGTRFTLHFAGNNTLVHGSSAVNCPNDVDLPIRAGDVVDVYSEGAGVARVQKVASQILNQNTTGNIIDHWNGSAWAALPRVVQVQSATTSAHASTGNVIPDDDTAPQNTEGAEAISRTITPKNSNNLLIVFGKILIAGDATGRFLKATLFHEGSSDAVDVACGTIDSNSEPETMSVFFVMTAGTTSEKTFSIRYGPATGGTAYINGNNAGSLFGSIAKTHLTVIEIASS